MTQAQPDFKPVVGETAEQKKLRLAAKRAHQEATEQLRREAMESEAKARLDARMKVMPAVLFELMLLAASFDVPAHVCLKDPDRSYGNGADEPGVQFQFDHRDSTYLAVMAEEWEVDQVREQFADLQRERDEAARQQALRESGRAKLLSVLDPEELLALGLK